MRKYQVWLPLAVAPLFWVLAREIAAGSQEQTQGIEEVQKAVAEMDQVVMHNASNAEETASASSEMNTQTELLEHLVGELNTIIAGLRPTAGYPVSIPV